MSLWYFKKVEKKKLHVSEGKGGNSEWGPLQNSELVFAYRKTFGNTSGNSVTRSDFSDMYWRTTAKKK